MKRILKICCLAVLCLGMGLSSAQATSGFNLEIGYWRIFEADTRFSEDVQEDADSILGVSGGGVTTSKTVLDVSTDPSKFLIDASYRFVDSLHRLKVGLMIATNGNDSVDEVSLVKQTRVFLGFIQDFNFNARSMNYTNLYGTYRLFPMSGSYPDDDTFEKRGVDVWVTWTSLEQDFSMSGSDFDITTDSVGIGIGGERDIINEQFSVSGRMIYLPFFDIEGSGWDTELRIAYDYNEYLQFFFGGKWVNIDVDTATSINFAAVPGFSDSPTVFKKYKADLGGYVLGGSFNF